jgi:hypothetical protein
VHLPKGTAAGAAAALEAVPVQNRNAWRLHHVESGDTLEAIARSYHLAPQKIVAVNRAADSLEAGDVLLIPAVYHEETTPRRVRAARGKVHRAVGTTKSTTARNGAHLAVTRHVPAQVLHRRAALRTASLE